MPCLLVLVIANIPLSDPLETPKLGRSSSQLQARLRLVKLATRPLAPTEGNPMTVKSGTEPPHENTCYKSSPDIGRLSPCVSCGLKVVIESKHRVKSAKYRSVVQRS
jgi:hypothetical protein